MSSVERTLEYVQLKEERSDSVAIPFPRHSAGKIEFDHVSLSYGFTPVLSDISCIIRGGERIGIVGRTGAGKSSLIAALFRLSELTSGTIQIDGIDIESIDLKLLRSGISIIPQNPTLFSGTIRFNLDPLSEYCNEQLWSVLESVNMKSYVSSLCDQLQSVLEGNGSSLSVGQRQLLCLARALLGRNRIIILDEATANVDYQTDELIQQTIREHFHSCTVLTIAHRIQSVIDYDRIMVMHLGSIHEFDSPQRLIKSKGMFYEMCQKTGDAHLIELTKG